jgi:hypothetical protein
MGRPRSPENYTQWKVHIDATIAARVEMRFFDPIRGKPKYGSRHELINELLREWLEKQEAVHA